MRSLLLVLLLAASPALGSAAETPSTAEETPPPARTFSAADAQALEAAIATSSEHGLRSDPIRRLLPGPAVGGADRDQALRAAFDAWAKAMLDGVVDPASLDHLIEPYEVTDLAPWHARLDQGKPMAQILADLLPAHPEYARLQAELASLQDAARKGWLPVPPHVVVKPEQRVADGDLRTVRDRLLEEGFVSEDCAPPILGPPTPTPVDVDPCVVEGIKAFQRSRGLGDDGVVGAHTRAEMNVTPRARIATLAANLERLRWREREVAERRVEVNLAAYTLTVHRPGSAPREMNVITGKVANATPLFRDAIERVVFHPYWNVPTSIASGEIIPSLGSSPQAALARKGMEVVSNGKVVDPAVVDWAAAKSGSFPYRIRQRPGSSNALGQVKFLFPNKYSIYLHDTPTDSLFERTDRNFSHGCVRVEDPAGLAELLLGPQGWDRARVDGAFADEEPQTVELEQTVPVILGYQTAHVQGDRVFYEQDVYGIDAEVIQALKRRR